ncbi:MAG TPA: bifunctional adenosylcobinamide kinase/adenosylcobinamide-phosphate guanylyltransferase [Thermodesulfobacteriota bacterium]|nr:bifunctional adenosylcobinamide kinase/adenosylcobinamide-phosphate guanylyltransferase [Thermodesulfobacteriota bacterium]
MGEKILITGGVKSGKSRFALKIAREIEKGEKIFIATARPIDEEMEDKIEKHEKERGSDFQTVEEPIHLGDILTKINQSTVVIDCLTLWLSNLFFEVRESEKLFEIESFIQALKEFGGNIIIVTNEVGWGIIPESETSRNYQAELGRLNQEVAEICDVVYVLISGIPSKIK